MLIADGTDLPKTGMHMESIGRIFSHVHHKVHPGLQGPYAVLERRSHTAHAGLLASWGERQDRGKGAGTDFGAKETAL